MRRLIGGYEGNGMVKGGVERLLTRERIVILKDLAKIEDAEVGGRWWSIILPLWRSILAWVSEVKQLGKSIVNG
jgi:hypothetical protein